jgi:putative transposase
MRLPRFAENGSERFSAKMGQSAFLLISCPRDVMIAAMPRPLRPIADRLTYHVINRGNNRSPIFFEDGDYLAFLKALGDLKQNRPFELYGYCLMPNHIHLLLRPGDTTISRLMQVLLGSHTQRYHLFHQSCGHVWQGRFKSPVIQDDDHLLTVLRYIEANPVRAKMVAHAGEYRWSSFGSHGLGRVDALLDHIDLYHDLAKTAPARQRRWSSFVHQQPSDEELVALRRSTQKGLPFGEPSWVEKLGERLGLDFVIRPKGRPRKKPQDQS